jgi:hypothetical protein
MWIRWIRIRFRIRIRNTGFLTLNHFAGLNINADTKETALLLLCTVSVDAN